MAARRLLLVDDSSTMRRMISALLTDEGYAVDLAVDGRDGLARAAELRPELILSDYEMPELNGPEFCRALKADPTLQNLPVLLLTTLGATESKLAGLNAGADDYIQKPKGPGEVQELFARIRAHLRIADLRAALADRNRQLELAQRKLTLELELARKVQLGLMPKAPKPRGVFRFGVRYTPANALGGDVYDFYRLDDERLGVLVADVSGHGVNSAMLSGMVKALASPLAAAAEQPGPVLAGLDLALEQYFPEGFFCTGFYLIAEESTGAIRYAGVGHPPAIVVGPAGPRLLASNPGLLGVGLADGTGGEVERIAPGETLFIYTDGLPDAMDYADVLFGEARLVELVQSLHREEPAAILDRIDAAVADHVRPGQAADDINMVILQHPAA